MDKSKIPLTNEERIKSIKMSGKKCSFGKTSILDCGCNDCHNNIIEYLGKKVGKKYLYIGKFKDTIENREVVIIHFSTDEDDETSSCECWVRRADSENCYQWIPRRDIFYNLKEIKNERKN